MNNFVVFALIIASAIVATIDADPVPSTPATIAAAAVIAAAAAVEDAKAAAVIATDTADEAARVYDGLAAIALADPAGDVTPAILAAANIVVASTKAEAIAAGVVVTIAIAAHAAAVEIARNTPADP